jgi:hypothetical protein
MGRHSQPRTTLRNAALVTAGAVGLAVALSGSASADPGSWDCDPHRATNPDVRVCHDTDRGDRGDTDGLHAIIKVDPLLCAHVVVADPQGHRRLVNTRDCAHHHPPVVTQPCPPCPPTVTAPGEAPGGTTQSGEQVAAPVPVTVVGGPVVTH